MLTVDPIKRITIKGVLNHPWLKDNEVITKIHTLLDLPEKMSSLRPFNDNVNLAKKRPRLD